MSGAPADRVRTAHRLGRPVLAPSGAVGAFDRYGVDSPFVFRHGGEFKMLYIGFDGDGYQTALARSADLIDWEHEAIVLARDAAEPPHSEQRWDSANAAGVWLLRDNALRGPATLTRWRDRYWMVYHSYPGAGYEEGPARIGLAWTADETLRTWTRVPEPILVPEGGEAWEAGGLYKGSLVFHAGLFHLFYNAKTVPDASGAWIEQTGLATSTDLVSWRRHPRSPVVPVSPGWASRYRSDPFVVADDGRWLMFHFGFDGDHAREALAVSDDLVDWRVDPDPLLDVGAPGSIDELHAHKPSVIAHDGRLHHFYTAVRPAAPGEGGAYNGQYRSITVAVGDRGDDA